MTTEYSTIQKLSLAGIVIGTLTCIVGAGAPYWLVSDPRVPDSYSIIGEVVDKTVKANVGLFMYCAQVVGNNVCQWFPGLFLMARLTAVVCMLLGGLSSLISLCLACCTCCKRIIAVGILAFLAAVSGAACAIIFAKNTDVFTESILGFKIASFGWAFYVFCAGTGILGLVSFLACFSAPENPIRGMVYSQPAAPTTVVTTQNQQQLFCGDSPQPLQCQVNALSPV